MLKFTASTSLSLSKKCTGILQSKIVMKALHSVDKRSIFTIPESSALFISNSVARKTSEFTLDLGLEDCLHGQNIDKMRENLKRRNIEFDLDALVWRFMEFQIMLVEYKELEQEKGDISERMRSLTHDGVNSEDKSEAEDLRKRGRSLREKFKSFNQTWWPIEESVMLTGLRLPNDLDEQTPECPVIVKVNDVDNGNSPSLDHVYIGQKDGLIKFSHVGRKAYYLFKDAALLEQNLMRYVSRKLEDAGYMSMICPDVFRSPVIEGCGVDFSKSEETLLIEESKEKHEKIEDSMYLAGVSLHSIVSYLCKTRINENELPLRFFTKGRNYASRPPSLSDDSGLLWEVDPELMLQHDSEMNCLHPSFGLYEALQTTAFHSLVLSENCEAGEIHHNEMIDLTWQMFTDLKLPVRMVRMPAERLHVSESSRTEFQLYSVVLKKYVTAAYVSNVRDYVSRRLEITTENLNFCYISHGCVFDVTKSIASYMENYFDDDINKYVFHDSLKNLMQ